MEIHLQFTFRHKERKAFAVIDYKEQPCYIFVFLKDHEMIKEFGDELSMKTDCDELLPADFPSAVYDELREAIFHEIKHTIEFATAKEAYQRSNSWPSEKEAG